MVGSYGFHLVCWIPFDRLVNVGLYDSCVYMVATLFAYPVSGEVVMSIYKCPDQEDQKKWESPFQRGIGLVVMPCKDAEDEPVCKDD